MAKLIFNYPFMKPEYVLNAETLSIGRVPGNDIVIPDYALFRKLTSGTQSGWVQQLIKVSRHHARMQKRDGQWFLEDLGSRGVGSTYGTYVNDIRLEVQKPYLLRSGDRIRLATVDIVFHDEEEASSNG